MIVSQYIPLQGTPTGFLIEKSSFWRKGIFRRNLAGYGIQSEKPKKSVTFPGDNEPKGNKKFKGDKNMNALAFPNQYNRAVKDFFQRCCQVETMNVKMMQEISMSLDNGYFTLYLETDENHFSQEFELCKGDKIDALNFIC